jgi:hypothetical protein
MSYHIPSYCHGVTTTIEKCETIDNAAQYKETPKRKHVIAFFINLISFRLMSLVQLVHGKQ